MLTYDQVMMGLGKALVAMEDGDLADPDCYAAIDFALTYLAANEGELRDHFLQQTLDAEIATAEAKAENPTWVTH